jgi:hypothetical protein
MAVLSPDLLVLSLPILSPAWPVCKLEVASPSNRVAAGLGLFKDYGEGPFYRSC